MTPVTECVKLFFMATITRSDELRYANRARVLASLRLRGEQSRTQIAESTGLSAATVTQVTAGLIGERIIVESNQSQSEDQKSTATVAPAVPVNKTIARQPVAVTEAGQRARSAKTGGRENNTARPGRPQVVLEMTADAALIAIVTINFDSIEATLFDYTGRTLRQTSSAISQTALSGKALLSRVQKTVSRALMSNPEYPTRLKHITVACQGRVSKQDGELLWSPVSRAEKIGVGSFLQSKFRVGVSVDNDCNMIASALYASKLSTKSDHDSANESSNEARHGDNFAAVLMSYGIGLGLIHEGSILTGSRSSGTELGHMQISADGPLCRCGKQGCIEAYAADYGIWRRAHGMRADQLPTSKIDRDSMQKIVATAHTTDGIERQALKEAGAAIGQGLANLFAIFDSFPTRLVGLDSAAAPWVAEAIHERLQASGDMRTEDIVSVHTSDSEIELIRQGAAMQCLHYVDRQIFSFGTHQSN